MEQKEIFKTRFNNLRFVMFFGPFLLIGIVIDIKAGTFLNINSLFLVTIITMFIHYFMSLFCIKEITLYENSIKLRYSKILFFIKPRIHSYQDIYMIKFKRTRTYRIFRLYFRPGSFINFITYRLIFIHEDDIAAVLRKLECMSIEIKSNTNNWRSSKTGRNVSV